MKVRSSRFTSFAIRSFKDSRLSNYSKSSRTLLRPLALAIPLWFAAQVANAESWKVNLQEADIRAFINEVANITGKNFVLDPRINGNVTVISNRAMSEDEIYQLFLSVMQVNGVIAIEKEGLTELKPDNLAKASGLPVDLAEAMNGEQMATRVIYLTNTQAAEILSVIRPLMPQSAHAAAAPSVNALVLSDRADSLNQLTTLIRDLDSNINDSVSVIPLRHTDAERMMEMISQLTGVATNGQAQAGSQLKVIADATSDRMIVKGSPEQIAKVQAMVSRLDTIPSKRLSGMRVFHLSYANATHVSNMIRALIGGESINSQGARSTIESASLANASNGNSSNASSTNRSATSSNLSASAASGNQSASTAPRRFSIIADETQNAVIVNASSDLMIEIEDAIKQLDTRRAQVLIQAAIVEISGDDAQQLGVQWALGNASSGYGVVNFSNAGATASSIAAAALSGSTTAISSAASAISGALLGLGDFRNEKFYGAILQAIDKTSSANLLSMPSIMTLDNEPASILVGQNVPFVTGSYTTSGNSSNNPFQTIDRQDVGINLKVIPHIGADGTIRLEVSQEVSSVVSSSASNNGLITNKSLINTTILAENQQTIALGGLMRDNSTETQQKVPGLGDVPLVGRLFRSDNESKEKSNLIIFLQPTILRNGGAVASVTERHLNQMRVMQLVIDANGTIKKIPLTGTQEWSNQYNQFDNGGALPNDGIRDKDTRPKGTKLNENYELMPLNPLINDVPPEGFTKINEPTVKELIYNKHNSQQYHQPYNKPSYNLPEGSVTPINHSPVSNNQMNNTAVVDLRNIEKTNVSLQSASAGDNSKAEIKKNLIEYQKTELIEDTSGHQPEDSQLQASIAEMENTLEQELNSFGETDTNIHDDTIGNSIEPKSPVEMQNTEIESQSIDDNLPLTGNNYLYNMPNREKKKRSQYAGINIRKFNLPRK